MTFNETEDEIHQTARNIAGRLRSLGHLLAIAESVTGGLLTDSLTDIPGASEWLKGSIVAYTREAKEKVGVPSTLIETYGCISEETARAMAEATKSFFATDWGVATTGVAGPLSAEGKPVGTAFIAVAGPYNTISMSFYKPGDRKAVKDSIAKAALDFLQTELSAYQQL